MKRYGGIKSWAVCFAAAFAVLMLAWSFGGKTVQAATSYRVTFRTGEVGTFTNTGALAAGYLAAYPGDVLAVRVLSDKAIELEVKAGSPVPAAPQATDITVRDGYTLRPAGEWGPASGERVDINKDYVADYKAIVEGVYYTVRLMDAAQGTDIIPPATIKGSVGDVISYTAPATQTNSMYHPYVLKSAATQSMTLTASGDNVLEFYYENTYDPGFYITGEIEYADQDYIVIEEDGGTTYVNGAQAIKEKIPQTVIVQSRQTAPAVGPVSKTTKVSSAGGSGGSASTGGTGNGRISPKTGDEGMSASVGEARAVTDKPASHAPATETELGKRNEAALARAIALLVAASLLGAVVMLAKAVRVGRGVRRR